MKPFKHLVLACLAGMMAACAGLTAPPPQQAVPAQWQAPLPHNGSVSDLSRWWEQQGDPILVQLIAAAQEASPTIAAARSRMIQAQTVRTAAGAALVPSLDATGSVGRTSAQPPQPLGTTSQAALQTAWEIDVFGARRASRNAADARLEGAQAGWHEARVTVAAEVASQYFGLRACRRQLAIAESDAASRSEIARLSELSARAGFQAPANAALARASAAEGNARLLQQRAQCEIELKSLVALTAIAEPALRAGLDGGDVSPEAAQAIAIENLPAAVLAQRPDLFGAEREVAAAAFEVAGAHAQRYPRLSLSGSVGIANLRGGGMNADLDTWSVGPLALSLPLFDGGRRAAEVEAARARYEEAAANYRARVRQAVREVEEALVTLHSTAARSADVLTAAEGYRSSFNAAESRYRNGLASLIELEESRRTLLAAETAVVTLERERRAAWISLYRAAGGGWNAPGARTTN
ncbi:efflux transporter outer membrane subunit [Noviherbaspirillum aridicola]|uniref:Membrane protein n=1 Tax=Noviherbaspirillum aridicola TaxID=2849687 RepID=A0ABQ4QAI7_9BURK|nr:efflux transporter outer membrane subunit [Noviherbaspirillum aridicola]GIZ53810.1 membrane protein [Noviherbaspirillum aridicola]